MVVIILPPLDWVAPLAGSVDRNVKIFLSVLGLTVAPLAGSVDRNLPVQFPIRLRYCVAPLAGSVDRNTLMFSIFVGIPSRSPRGERG